MTLIIDMSTGESREDNITTYEMQSPAAPHAEVDVPETTPELALGLQVVEMETRREKRHMPDALLMADIDSFLDNID